MKIHLATKQVLRPDVNGKDKKAYAIYRRETGKAEAYDTLDFTALGMPDYTEPVVGANQKRTDVVIDNGTGGKTFEVVDLTQEELDARLLNERLGMVLTPRQFRRALLSYPGKLQQVEDYIAAQSEEDKIDWAHGGSVDRLYPLTVAMITELGFTDEQADSFFRNAATI